MFDSRIFYLQLTDEHRVRRHLSAAVPKRVHRLPDRRQARPEVRG
jgi:hypothetical protein